MVATNTAATNMFAMDPSALADENHALQEALTSLKQQILDSRRNPSARGSKRRPSSGAEQLKAIDRALAKARRESMELREAIETHAGDLDVNQRMKNVAIDAKARLDKQNEENTLLERQNTRQAEQLSQIGLSAAQTQELERLREQNSEIHESLRAAQQRSAELARKQHAVQLQWTKLCMRQQKLKRDLAETGGPSVPHGVNNNDGVAGGADKIEARIEHAAKALKLAVHAGHGQSKRHQQRMLAEVAELKSLRHQAEALGARIEAEQPDVERQPLPEETDIEAFGHVAAYVPKEAPPEPPAPKPPTSRAHLVPTPPAGARVTKPGGRGTAAAAAAPAVDPKLAEEKRQQAAATKVQASVRGRQARVLAQQRAEARAAEKAAAEKSALNPFGLGQRDRKRGVLGGVAIQLPVGGQSAQPAPYRPVVDATALTAATPLAATKPQFSKPFGKPSDSRPFHIVPQAAPTHAAPTAQAASPSESSEATNVADPAPAAVDATVSTKKTEALAESVAPQQLKTALPVKTARTSIIDDLDDLDIPDGVPTKAGGGGLVPSAAPCRPIAANTAATVANGSCLGPLAGARPPPKPNLSIGQENMPPRGVNAAGRGGGIASTLAAARMELDEGVPRPMRLAQPGPTRALPTDATVPRPSFLNAKPALNGAPPLGAISLGRAPDEFDVGTITTLDDGPRNLKAAPAARSLNLKAPSFDDDLDDEAMAAEEQAFLARMKAKGTVSGTGPVELPMPSRAAAPIVVPLAAGRVFDGFDDLSEEEI